MPKQFLALFLLFVPAATLSSDCTCKQAPAKEKTRTATEEVIILEKNPVAQLRGTVKFGDKKAKGALVEVFNHAERLLDRDPVRQHDAKQKQKRLAACFTGNDGSFCFPSLPPGTYELRASFSGEFAPTCIHVKVDPDHGKARSLVLWFKAAI